MRRVSYLTFAAMLLVLGLGLVLWRFAAAPTVLRVAVGPPGSEDARLVSAIGQHLAREHDKLRLKVVSVPGEAESAAAMDEDRADLAVVRTDIAMPNKGQTVAIMHRDAAVLVTLGSRGITSIPGLRGRTVGVVRRGGPNSRLLEMLLAHYEVPRDNLKLVALEDPSEVEEALRSGQIDAVFAVGTLSGRSVSETVSGVTAAGDGAAPVFIPVNEAEAIAQRAAPYEAFEIVRGAFGGAIPRPTESVKTLGVSHRLVATSTLEEGTVSELARLIFAMRPSLATSVPLANRIEGPDTSKSSSLPVHPGAAAYYDDEVQTFLDRYSDMLYLGAMVVSVVASAGAGLLSRAASKRRARTLGRLEHLIEIVEHTRHAGSAEELDAIDRELDTIFSEVLEQVGTGSLDGAAVSAFTLGLAHARNAVSERRASLPSPALLPLQVAAE